MYKLMSKIKLQMPTSENVFKVAHLRYHLHQREKQLSELFFYPCAHM